MTKLRMMILAGAALAGACSAPRMKTIEASPASQRPYGFPIDVYEGKIAESHRKIAVIESAAYASDDEETRLRQVGQLKQRAREVGADAVEDVRILTKKIKGLSLDEKTPTASFKQGAYVLYFMRGTAVILDTGLPGAVSSPGGFTTGPEGYVTPEKTPAAGAAAIPAPATTPLAETPAVEAPAIETPAAP